MDDLQALQREAMKRVADVIEEVQASLAHAQEEIMRKYFADDDPEPVFVFRAQDQLALSAIATYYSACLINGLTEHAAEVQKAMHDFQDWKTRNPERMKMPDKKHVGLPKIPLHSDPSVTPVDQRIPFMEGDKYYTEESSSMIPEDFQHGAQPEYCGMCPDPHHPSFSYHTTGMAHTNPRVGRPIRDNPQA